MEALFAKIRTQESSKLANQQQAAATLIAVEEMLTETGVKRVPAAYFGTMFTLLEQQASMPDEGGMRGAILYLMAAVFPELDTSILRAKAKQITTVLIQCYQQDSESAPAVKSILTCIQYTLMSLDAASWSKGGGSMATMCLQLLLKVAFDPRPKVRRKAQDALVQIIRTPPTPLSQHPAVDRVTGTCLQVLQATTRSDQQASLFALTLCKSLAGSWPASALHPLCETILPLPKLNNSYLTVAVFEVFEALFQHGASSFAGEGSEGKISELLSSLLAMKPDNNDQHLAPTWLRIIAHGYVAFAQEQPVQCGNILPQVFELIYPDLQSDRPSLISTATNTLCALIEGAMTDAWLADIPGSAEGVERMVTIAGSGLSYRYRDAWGGVLLILGTLYKRLDSRAFPVMNSCLVALDELRNEKEFEHRDVLDATLGSAIAAIGPEVFLSVLPLNLENSTGSNGNGRAFLLPILRDYISNTDLSYFTQDLLPLADRLQKRAAEFSAQNKDTVAMIFTTLSQQIWKLLPGFFTLPVDFPEAFSEELLQRILQTLATEADLRSTVCTSFGLLVTRYTAFLEAEGGEELEKNPGLLHGLTRAKATASLEVFSQHGRAILATLSNLYAASPAPSRGYILDTIRILMGPSVSKPQDVLATFTQAQGILSQALTVISEATAPLPEDQATMPHTMLDLLCGILSCLQHLPITPELESTLRGAFVNVVSQLNNTQDPTMQKKAYKLLGRLLEGDEYCKASETIVQSEIDGLVTRLLEAGPANVPGAKKERLHCLSRTTQMLTTDLTAIPMLLSEAVLGTKEVNEKSREAAYDLLVVMGRKMNEPSGVIQTSRVTGDPEAPSVPATLPEYFTMVTAGLTGSTAHMVSATIASLARLLYEFHTELPLDKVTELLQTVLLMVQRANREVVKAALGFVKVTVVSLPVEVVRPQLQSIVQGALMWSGEHKAHFKSKVRHLLERMIRRFGLDDIAQYVPESDQKLIANIRKRKERARRQKAEGSSKAKDEDETMQTEETGASMGGKKIVGSATAGASSKFDEVLYGSDSELDDDNEDDEDEEEGRRGDNHMGEGGGRKSRGKKSSSSRKEREGDQERQTLIREGMEDEGNPVDFLDRTVVSRVVSVTKTKGSVNRLMTASQRAQALRSRRQSQLASAFVQTKDGRMVIREDGSGQGASSMNGDAGDGSDVEMPSASSIQFPGPPAPENLYEESLKNSRETGGFRRGQNNRVRFSNKPGREDDSMMDHDADSQVTGPQRSGKRGAAAKGKQGLDFGREYRSKRAGGDVKRGGALDPYAYIPLSGKAVGKGGRNSAVRGLVSGNRRPGRGSRK